MPPGLTAGGTNPRSGVSDVVFAACRVRIEEKRGQTLVAVFAPKCGVKRFLVK